jgi:hypothetical protein
MTSFGANTSARGTPRAAYNPSDSPEHGEAQMAPRWEYMILDVGVSGFWLGPNLDGNALTAKLNELGAEGWEALGLTEMSTQQGRTKDLVIILKRQSN